MFSAILSILVETSELISAFSLQTLLNCMNFCCHFSFFFRFVFFIHSLFLSFHTCIHVLFLSFCTLLIPFLLCIIFFYFMRSSSVSFLLASRDYTLFFLNWSAIKVRNQTKLFFFNLFFFLLCFIFLNLATNENDKRCTRSFYWANGFCLFF